MKTRLRCDKNEMFVQPEERSGVKGQQKHLRAVNQRTQKQGSRSCEQPPDSDVATFLPGRSVSVTSNVKTLASQISANLNYISLL